MTDTPALPDVTVYSKPACPRCRATARTLDEAGVPYTYLDVTRDPDAYQQAMATGFTELPIVVVSEHGETQAVWTGYRVGSLKTLATPGLEYRALDARTRATPAGE